MTNSSVAVSPFSGSAEVKLYTLSRETFKVCISTLGATVTNVFVPNQAGETEDVVLGFDDLKPYQDGTSPYFGCVVGRVANRIAGAQFSLDGTTYHLPANDGSNTLHGGIIGFDKVVWESEALESSDGPSVKLTHVSPDGDQGFPGAVEASVTYTLTQNMELKTVMVARALTEATPINLAHHTYWNLGGHQSGSVLDHVLQLRANHYTPVGQTLIPTGEIAAVARTSFDFTQPAAIGSRISNVEGGYDHNYVLDKEPTLKLAAVVTHPASGRVMELLTDAPGVQFYSGNFLDASFKGKGGALYGKHAGFCLETQGFPNSVNEPLFPSVIVRPGELYKHTMIHRFSYVPK